MSHLEAIMKLNSLYPKMKYVVGSGLAYGGVYIWSNYIYPFLTKSSTGYSSVSTAESVSEGIDLTGKVCIVTGSGTGIGKETARVLALRGATVILASRSVEKLEIAKQCILKGNKNAKLIVMALDLGSFDSITKFVEEFKKMNLPLHILVNNAFIMSNTRLVTKDGLEQQMGVNHFGHFKLTLMLLPIMKATEGEKRIVVVSSKGHTYGSHKIDWDDLQLVKTYTMWMAYAQSKLANIMFAKELNRKLKEDAIPIVVNAVHPGRIPENDHIPWVVQTVLKVFEPLFFKSVAQGASTSVYCAVNKDLNGHGGEYLEDTKISQCLPIASNVSECKKLWEVSEQVTATKYPF